MEESLGEWVERTLAMLYGEDRAPGVSKELAELVAGYRGRIGPPVQQRRWDQGDALLITYADSIVGEDAVPLAVLHRFLRRHVGKRVSFVHLLPFFPWSSDDGFSVVDFREVEEKVGGWEEVEALGREYRLAVDGVINHVSQESAYIRGFLADDPRYANFAIALPPETDTRSVLRTRNLPLLHDYRKGDGTTVWLWTTFSRDQVDLNYQNPAVLLEMVDVLLFYAARGARMIRLDAIPYLWKRLGSSCAHLPETHAIIKLLRRVLDAVAPHVLLLTETNVPHEENMAYFGDRGDEAQVIYNFSLAPLILFSIAVGDATHLTAWAAGVRKVGDGATYLNITATHDGIGMRPTEGLLSEEQRQVLLELAREHHGDITGKRNPDGSIAPYELNLNYFDAVNHPDSDEPMAVQVRRFMLSQAIPLSFIGIPGIYIHSLLGSRNDLAGVARSGRARSINREQLVEGELDAELAEPESLRAMVFAEYCRLLEIRATEPCLHPDAEQEVLELGSGCFALRRTAGDRRLTALHNVTPGLIAVEAGQGGAVDLLTGERLAGGSVPLGPYQVRWLVEGAVSPCASGGGI